jgi:HPt (histidine-containing phosphotransfer) domain-containing protein
MHERVEQVKNDLLANISHGMRAPLTRMIKMVDLALAGSLSRTARNRLLLARSSGESLLAVTDYMLGQSTIEAGKSELEIAEFSLNRMLIDIEAVMLARAGQKELEFIVAIGNPLPRRIYSDARRIRQSLFNLLDNAIKFTDEGFVRLRVSTEGEYSGASIRFDVEDSGVGISKENRRKIFEQFDHTEHAVAGKFIGAGLGLAIANKLAGELGGSIILTSQEGKGTTASLTIPAGIDLASQETMTELDRITAEQGSDNIDTRLFEGMADLEENIDAAMFAIDEIILLASGLEPSPRDRSDSRMTDDSEIPIDWATIMHNCGGEDMASLAVQAYVEDAPRVAEKLAEAVEARKSQDVELYAHTMKGAAALIGANQLSEAARRLEFQGRVNNIETFVFYFDEVQVNFEKVIAFVSQADWMERARMRYRNGH